MLIYAYRNNMYIEVPLPTLFLTPFCDIWVTHRNVAKPGWCLVMVGELWTVNRAHGLES